LSFINCIKYLISDFFSDTIKEWLMCRVHGTSKHEILPDHNTKSICCIIELFHLINLQNIQWLLLNAKYVQLLIMVKMMMISVCSGPTCWVGYYSSSSLKQKSADRHVGPLWHIILIPREQDFVLTPLCWLLSRVAVNTTLIVFGLTQQVLEPLMWAH
jgi:hypothetical protein